MVFSLGHLVIFSGKPENQEIPGSCRENPDNLDRVGTKAIIFFKKSSNNKLYEYYAILWHFFLKKSYSTSKLIFTDF